MYILQQCGLPVVYLMCEKTQVICLEIKNILMLYTRFYLAVSQFKSLVLLASKYREVTLLQMVRIEVGIINIKVIIVL